MRAIIPMLMRSLDSLGDYRLLRDGHDSYVTAVAAYCLHRIV